MINPNKVVHFEDSGKRLSQYYTTGQATMDSKRAFEQEEKIHSRRIKHSTCSPINNMSCFAKLYKKTGDYHETTVATESIVCPLDQRIVIDQPDLVVHNLVNDEALREYRVKYADSKKTISRIGDKECNSSNVSIEINKERSEIIRSRHQEECEACKIEKLLDINY